MPATTPRSDTLEGGLQSRPLVEPIAPAELGSATLAPTGDFTAGSYQTFTLVYTAGRHGIDDSGSLRVCFRFAADQSRPQLDDPAAVGYTTVTASNDAVLRCRYDPKGNVRPWDRTLEVAVVHGFLREGDTITVRFGDPRGGSPGLRLQTFCEDSFEFHVLVDPIATQVYQPLPVQPTIRIIAGPPARWVGVLPTVRRTGETFALKLKAEDKWGNPCDRVTAQLHLHSNVPVDGLPHSVRFAPGAAGLVLDGLTVDTPADVDIRIEDERGDVLTRANAMRIVAKTRLLPYWADLHGQSEETIGTNSARDYFVFARDRAFLDAAAHQGNDFQITSGFWTTLNALSAQFNDPGRFLTVPGYEWSGNTGLGGDRNVYFAREGRQIRRSSHALVPDTSDLDTDATTAADLFRVLTDTGEDVVCFAHCGGRYADIKLAHDGRIERSMEIHSAWGTFEWLVEDAFEMGYRVGIVANSDGHKGRPGASYPGASQFGAIGGLTCLLMPELTREALMDCLRKRHHFATTGARMVVDIEAHFPQGGTRYHDDPALGPATGRAADSAIMGDIVRLPHGELTLRVEVLASAPIERLEIFNGLERLETIRPYAPAALGRRIRVLWEGAQYRGRFRQVVWDGEAVLRGNRILDAVAINFFNPEKMLERVDAQSLRWRSLTTGNFSGFDMEIETSDAGVLELKTPLIRSSVPLESIGYDDHVIDRSATLPRRLRLFRLPTHNPHRRLAVERRIAIRQDRDNALFVKLTQEDGHVAWTSPIYVFR